MNLMKEITVSLESKIQGLFSRFGLVVLRRETFRKLNSAAIHARTLGMIQALPGDISDSLAMVPESKAQLGQDIAALAFNNFSQNGFFVEFGATNGLDLSNTYLLEKRFGWRGILAEPAKMWHRELAMNRDAILDLRCVWKSSGENLPFTEAAELSTIQTFTGADQHSATRGNKASYSVETVSLADLLNQHGAPRHINYLSIDTEGSEFSILESFDFKSYSFSFISVEHNHTQQRSDLHNLLSQNGYKRVLENFSDWDDWYVPSTKVTEK